MGATEVVTRVAEGLKHGFEPGNPLSIYGRLVRSSIRGAFASILPRTYARLGKRFEADLDLFLASGGPATRYVRDSALELCAQASPAWEKDGTLPPGFLAIVNADLVRRVGELDKPNVRGEHNWRSQVHILPGGTSGIS